MTRYFSTNWWGIYVINAIVTISCFIAYFLIDGRQLVYTLYIPLDFLFNFGKVSFYLWYRYQDDLQKAEQERLARRLKKKPSL